MILHTSGEDFPWHGSVLAVHLIRFFSISLGLVSVVATYALATEVSSDQNVRLLAASITAFNPMFLFITGSVNNDNLIVATSTIILLLLVKSLKYGLTTYRIVVVAVLLAFGSITKISGLTLYPLAGIVALVISIRAKDYTLLVRAGVWVVVAWLLVAGWWYLRNLYLYGELLGINTQAAIDQARSITFWDLRYELLGFWINYWGLFGAVNILMDDVIYWFYGALCVMSICGTVYLLFRRLRTDMLNTLVVPVILASFVFLIFSAVISWTMQTYASQGRLMFPAIGVISLFMARGIIALTAKVRPQWIVRFLIILLAAIAWIAPFQFIQPVYASPLAVETIPDSAIPIHAVYDGFEIIAAETEIPTVQPGGYIPITLYVRVNKPVDVNYSLFVHALGRRLEEVGKIDTFPGNSSVPTTRMRPGEIIKDDYRLHLDEYFDAPTLIRLQIGAGIRVSETEYQALNATTPDGKPISSIILDGGVAYPAHAEECRLNTSNEREFRFGDFASVRTSSVDTNVTPNSTVSFDLSWNYRAHTPTNWTLFVQLTDSAGNIIVQGDGPTLDNDLPTSYWRKECWFTETRVLAIPENVEAGSYRLLIGLYDPLDPLFQRALVMDSSDSLLANNAIVLGTVMVTR
jgi:hypothetical protein